MDWKEQMPENHREKAEGEARRPPKEGGRWVTLIQVIACALVLLAALALKALGGEWYQQACDWYQEAMDDSLTVGTDWDEAVEYAGAQLVSYFQ